MLTYKPRSITELRTRLLEKDWTDETIVDEVIEKLTHYGYLDDAQFARSFAASQIRQKPLGKMALKIKLTQQAKRLRLKGKPENRDDAKKFYDYLLRQGFSYDLVATKMREIASKSFDEEG
ncbi:MAG: RecX family transcriptional regulator [Acidobacteria bacterium]|nr:RecX family transcriptional regulator [Acidobacteriota bacterium]